LHWKFSRPDGTYVDKHIGGLLSGEKLVDNPEFKKELSINYPTAIGGEMEGHGLYAAAARHGKNWIIVKGVCDWADGKKNKQFQAMAAASAVSICAYVFSNRNSLEGL